MTILTLPRKELESKIGKVTKEMEDKITMMGTPVEEATNGEVSVEVFPNRPDLLSLQNFSLAVNNFNSKKGLAKFSIKDGEKDYVVKVEKSVKSVRPYTVCAIVKGIKFDDEKIKEIIDIQEKLHNSIGRKRKRVAIGIYPLEKIKLPITFSAKKPEDISFVPLESPGRKEMKGRQILRAHPTGREYADLLKGYDAFPIFTDADGKILSMPPIINSEETGRITEKTKEIFIECSGHNLHYLKKCLNILVLTFSEMGGRVYSMQIKDSKEGNFKTPDMSQKEMLFDIKDIEKTLGIKLTQKEVRNYLGRMGIGYEEKKGKSIALIPAYRTDILHWIDLTEEIAIAYGYENFKPEIPNISTIGEEDSAEKTKGDLSEILANCGLLEVSSFHLANKKDVKKMHFDYKDFLQVEDSKTDRDVLRVDLISGLLQILSENSDAGYPQKIFEIGRVFEKDSRTETGVKETEKLAIALSDEEISFTDMKQILDYFFKMIDLEFSIENVEDSNYINGRVAKIIVNKDEVGRIGEISPRVLRNWKIKMPVVALEINLNFLLNKS